MADGEVVRLGAGVSLGVKLGVGVMGSAVGVDKNGEFVGVSASEGVGMGVGIGVADGKP